MEIIPSSSNTDATRSDDTPRRFADLSGDLAPMGVQRTFRVPDGHPLAVLTAEGVVFDLPMASGSVRVADAIELALRGDESRAAEREALATKLDAFRALGHELRTALDTCSTKLAHDMTVGYASTDESLAQRRESAVRMLEEPCVWAELAAAGLKGNLGDLAGSDEPTTSSGPRLLDVVQPCPEWCDGDHALDGAGARVHTLDIGIVELSRLDGEGDVGAVKVAPFRMLDWTNGETADPADLRTAAADLLNAADLLDELVSAGATHSA